MLQSHQPLSELEIARATPLTFANYVTDGRVKIPPHLKLLNRYLVEVAAGNLKRLMVFMPPRHGKSWAISQWFPAWYLMAYPDRRIILAAYEANFAKSWGRKARDIVQEFGGPTFDIEVNEDVAAASEWGIAGHEGGMITAGVGGPILGRGGDVIIIDDPLKNAEDAESPTVQQKQKDWFDSTLETRLEPGGSIIILMQRWSRNDLAGQLLNYQTEEDEDLIDDEQWTVIEMPALAKENDILGRAPGEALWPERYSADRLERKKRRSNFWFQSLYQQDPMAARGMGSKFQREWFKPVDRFPSGCRRFVAYLDLAATEKKKKSHDPDYTALCLMSECGGEYYFQPRRTRQNPSGTEQWIKEQRDQITRDIGRHVEWYMEQEPGASGVIVINHYARQVFNGYIFQGVKTTGDKELRINVFASTSAPLPGETHGRLHLVLGGATNEFLTEAEAFPAGDHDDMLDTGAGALEKFQNANTNVAAATGTMPRREIGNRLERFGGRLFRLGVLNRR